jgi:hypothetical protein
MQSQIRYFDHSDPINADESNTIRTAKFWHQNVTCIGGGGMCDENNGFYFGWLDLYTPDTHHQKLHF